MCNYLVIFTPNIRFYLFLCTYILMFCIVTYFPKHELFKTSESICTYNILFNTISRLSTIFCNELSQITNLYYLNSINFILYILSLRKLKSFSCFCLSIFFSFYLSTISSKESTVSKNSMKFFTYFY